MGFTYEVYYNKKYRRNVFSAFTHEIMTNTISTWPMNNENSLNTFGDAIFASSPLKIYFPPQRNRVSKMTIRQWWMYTFSKWIEIWPYFLINIIINDSPKRRTDKIYLKKIFWSKTFYVKYRRFGVDPRVCGTCKMMFSVQPTNVRRHIMYESIRCNWIIREVSWVMI